MSLRIHAAPSSVQHTGQDHGFCRKFSFEAICGMISLHDQRYNMRERDMAISFKGAHFPPEVILMGVRWYVAYPLRTRHVEELMEERGVHVDHSTINRWVIKYSPQLEEAFHRRKRPVWVSWRLCRKVGFWRPNPKIGYQKINDLRVSTFLFSVICDRAPISPCG
jgi:hypothetical protein